MGKRNETLIKRTLFLLIGLLTILFFLWMTIRYFDIKLFSKQIKLLLDHPLLIVSLFITYSMAFIFRGLAWQRYLTNNIPLSQYVDALFYSLFINHLAPVKVGDVVRTGFLMKKANVNWDSSLHSVIMMRLLDILILGFIAIIGAFATGLRLSIWLFTGFILFGIVGLLIIYHLVAKRGKLSFLNSHIELLKKSLVGNNGFWIIVLIIISWFFEAFVVFGISYMSGFSITFLESIWVNSVTVSGQIFHITPGGLGNYESFMSTSLLSLGFSWKEAYHIAILTHGFKFIFSYIVGIYVMIKHPIRMQEMKSWIKRKGR